MNKLFLATLSILVFLAVTSGLTKIMLMPQDVEFFGQYGFSNPLLIAFGSCQFVGGVLLAISKTRILGAFLVAITFLISAVVLFLAGNIVMMVVTLVFVGVLIYIIKYTQHLKQIEIH